MKNTICLCPQDEQDVYILSKVSDIIHSLFGTHKEATLPVFDQLLPHFSKLIVSMILNFQAQNLYKMSSKKRFKRF